MNNKLNIDFGGQDYVFIHTPTEEQYQDLFNRLTQHGLPYSDDKLTNRPEDTLQTVIYIHNTNQKWGHFSLKGYHNGYDDYKLYKYDEFITTYFINLEDIIADLDKKIMAMEERLDHAV